MGHLGSTLEFNPQTLPKGTPNQPQSTLSNPPPQKPLMDIIFAPK